MKTRSDTWMALYWGDYLRDTMHLRAEGHGAYLLLIAAYWCSGGPLPDNDEYLIGVTRLEAKAWQKLKPILAAFFTVEGGLWRHNRVDQEIAKANHISSVRQEAGKRGGKHHSKTPAIGEANAGANGEAIGEANAKQNATPSQSPSPPPERKGVDDAPNGAHPPKGSRLPPDWQPSEANRNYAIAHMLGDDQIAREAERFRNYWTAKSGRDAAKLDWDATWRNWILSAGERLPGAKPTRPAVQPMGPAGG